jgi:hypothetical protein
VDLARAVVVAPAQLSGPERKALALLTDEVHKRTLVRWEVVHAWPAHSVPVIAVGPASRVRVAYLAGLDGFLRGHSCWRW